MIKTYSHDTWFTKSKFCLYIICCSPNTADTITYVNNSILNNNLVWFQFCTAAGGYSNPLQILHYKKNTQKPMCCDIGTDNTDIFLELFTINK